jgi:type IV pilus assembly protein PilP
VWLLVCSSLAGCGEPDIQDLQKFVADTKASTPGQKLEPPPEVKPYHPIPYTAQGLKDPFVVSAFAQQQIVVEEPQAIDNGIRPDPDRVREELEKYSLGSLKMVGTFRRLDGILWALVQAPDGIVHRVQKGNYLGTDHGKIINITEQRVELNEIVSAGEGRWTEREAFLSLAE